MNFLARLQRELPDTDKDRYDIAYEQGQTQARSGLLFGGMLAGALAGVTAMFLFDPARGAGRRAQIASRVTGLRNNLARTAGGRAEDLQNRARGAAIEAGVKKPDRASEAASTDGAKRQTASTR
jgi:gas vesicle protein